MSRTIKVDYLEAIYWLIANKGVAILPEFNRREPLMGDQILQLTHKQLHQSSDLKNAQLCTMIAKRIPVIASAIATQESLGAGWLDFIDSYSYASQMGDSSASTGFVPNWLLAADIDNMQISPAYKDLFRGLVEHSIDSESFPCSFRAVPIGFNGRLLFTSTVVFMIQTPASQGFEFPIALSAKRLADAASR